jgi:hypothetical protein
MGHYLMVRDIPDSTCRAGQLESMCRQTPEVVFEGVATVLECQRQLGMERGKRMAEMVERVTGAPCACLRGEPCILIPRQRKPEEPTALRAPESAQLESVRNSA